MTRMMIIMAAIALDAYGISSVLPNTDSEWILVRFLLEHAAASMLLAWSTWYFLPPNLREPRLPVSLLLFNFAFLIPILGIAGILGAARIADYLRRVSVAPPFTHVPLPEFITSRSASEVRFSPGGIRSRLARPSIPPPQRLHSLLALQAIPPHLSSRLLQTTLADHSDDIRLVAYGLLDSREKAITEQIHRELANLKTAPDEARRLIFRQHLAELYWELVYSGLAQGDLLAHALDQALSHVDGALQLAPQDAGLQFLKARILHRMKRDAEAYPLFEEAMRNGLPEARVLSYLAEIEFDRGDYAAVRRLLALIPESQVTPLLKPAIRFWTSRPRARESAAKMGET